jgi:pimeloyl-ACP methyl ester carboxylesterase
MPWIEIADARLHYVDEGAAAETIVFAHGLLWSGEMFRPQIDALKSRYRCIAWDHRGQGRSSVTRGGYDMETLTGDAARLIERLGAAPCHFVGLSMGGFVGMRLAARRPELVRSLVLLATAADPEPRRNVPRYALLSAIARTIGLAPVVEPVMKILFGGAFLADPARADLRDELRARLRSVDRVGAVRATWGVILRRGVEHELSRVRVPTLILAGEDDRAIATARARRTAERIPRARLQTIPRAGHTSTLEEPEAVTRAISEFISGSQ